MKKSLVIRNSLSWGTLASVFALLCATAVVPKAAFQEPGAAQDPEKKMPFGEEDLKEKKLDGKYRFSAMPDSRQASDPAALAIVNRVNISAGRGRYSGLVKIASVGVENRYPQTLKWLQLKWRMVRGDNPQEVLQEGGTTLFEVTVSARSSKVIEIPHIFYNQIVKPLVKNNELHGDYRLLISVSNAVFEDGAAWQ